MAFTSIKRDTDVEEFLLGAFREMIEEKEEPDNSAYFRSSRFPYCAIMDMEAMVNGEGEFQAGYVSEFYTKSGTAHHENIQYWMPKLKRHGKNVWGDWGCTNYHCPEWNKVFKETGERTYKNVGHVHFAPPKDMKKGLKPKECPACKGTKFKYLEIAFAREFGVSGHVDKVLYVGGHIIIIDYKTTTFARFEGDWAKYLPYDKNVAQIANYCVMFKRKYKVTPRAWCLVYVPRERPENQFNGYGPIVLPLAHKWNMKEHKKYARRLNRANRGRSAVDQLLLEGYVVKRKDGKNVVKTKKGKAPENKINELATAVVEARPCRKALEYETYMKGKFDFKGECPHFKTGKCAVAKAAPKIMVDRVKYLRKEVLSVHGGPPKSVVDPNYGLGDNKDT